MNAPRLDPHELEMVRSDLQALRSSIQLVAYVALQHSRQIKGLLHHVGKAGTELEWLAAALEKLLPKSKDGGKQ